MPRFVGLHDEKREKLELEGVTERLIMCHVSVFLCVTLLSSSDRIG